MAYGVGVVGVVAEVGEMVEGVGRLAVGADCPEPLPDPGGLQVGALPDVQSHLAITSQGCLKMSWYYRTGKFLHLLCLLITENYKVVIS